MSTLSFRSLPLLSCCALGVLLLLSAAARQETKPDASGTPEWRILVTNDDGIETKALAQLVTALSLHAEVVVCAPDGNRSGSSQSVRAWSEAMAVREAVVEGASLAVAVGGNPADAVSYGLFELGKDKAFDLVVSGINEGANVGDLSHYSGTVGAAMEAAYRGVPAIAVSHGGRSRDYSCAADFTARFALKLLARESRPGLVYSINVPAGSAENMMGVALRPMGGSYVVTRGWSARETEAGEAGAIAQLQWLREAGPEGSDTKAFLDGFVTVTPLQFNWTDQAALRDLEDWNLAVE